MTSASWVLWLDAPHHVTSDGQTHQEPGFSALCVNFLSCLITDMVCNVTWTLWFYERRAAHSHDPHINWAHGLVAVGKTSLEGDDQLKVITRCIRSLLVQNDNGKHSCINISPLTPLEGLPPPRTAWSFPDWIFLSRIILSKHQSNKHFLRAALEAETNPWAEW